MITDNKFLWVGAGVGALALLYLVKKPGAAAAAGESIGSAAVEVVTGTVNGAVSTAVTDLTEWTGLPTPAETITDAQECKLYLDENGMLAASAKCSAPAFFKALTM